ncbi:MAG: patatin-like phospholipase family protein [Woeseiaceae bacterium]|nr:patatin-like phospholipase family protein [Woeseiaceae bacterium]
MRIFSSTFIVCLVLLGSGLSHALESDERPRIGLALSGGGTKAGAHIGVLRVLDENRVPIDYIAGTSAGAIIGSLYAVGLSPDEIEAAVADIDWDDMLEDSPARADLPFRRKRDSYNYLVKYRPGYNAGQISLPMGLVHGQKVVQFLRRHLDAYSHVRDFDELPIPLRVVATDLTNGDAIVIGDGDLALAVRASMSIPVFFTPVEIDGRRLIDGGAANNLPIDVVRQMGADVVIAVDITSPLLRDEELDSAVSVADQMINLLTQRTVQEQVAGLRADDILIKPDLEGIGGLDFSKTLNPIAPGEQAAQSALPALANLSLSEHAYKSHVVARGAPPLPKSQTFGFVHINNGSEISTEAIRSRLGISAGDPVDVETIEQGIAAIYGLDLFERVDYQFEHRESDVGIRVDVIPKRWGPGYLQFGLNLSEDFSQGSDFNLGVGYLRTAMNGLGGEWRAQLDLGERQGVSFDWYQPLDYRSRYFVEAEILARRRNFRFFERDDAIADLRVEGWGGSLSAGAEIGQSAELRLGWGRFTGDADVTVGVLDVPDDSVEIGELFAALTYDRLDNVNFPRHGAFGGIAAYWSREAAGSRSDFEQYVGGFSAAGSWGEYSVLAGLEGGTTPGDDAPLESQFLLGGLGRLSGYASNQFAGQHYGLASIAAYRRLSRNLWSPTYAGLSIEAGNAWDNSDLVSSGDLRFAGSAFVGTDTPIGPLYLAWGLAEGGNSTAYLYLGNPFIAAGARPLD